MTTADSTATIVNISNETFALLSDTLGAMREQNGHQSLTLLVTRFFVAKNHKGHSRAVAVNSEAASALRLVIAQATTPDTERKLKTVSDKIDTAFPEGATAVYEEVEPTPDVEQFEPDNAPTDDVTSHEDAVDANLVDHDLREEGDAEEDDGESDGPDSPKEPEANVKAPKAEKAAPVGMARIKRFPGGVVLDILADEELRALIVRTDVPDLEKHKASASSGPVRYRSKSRTTGTFAAVVDLSGLKIAGLPKDFGATIAMVCESHGTVLPLPNVRPGRCYVRRPGLFCPDCATTPRPVKAAPEPKIKAPKAEKVKREKKVKLPKGTKVVAEQNGEAPVDDVPSVVHASDERAPGESWETFAADTANETGATVMWIANRQYALSYGEGRDVDVYVNTHGAEYKWRVATSNYDSLDSAKAALGI